jgi:Ni/Co efflux regulator RcnB
MKRYFPLLLVLFLGSTSRYGQSATGPLPLGGGDAAAQYRGQRYTDDDRDDRRHDNDRKFDDHDRQAARDYYEHHRNDRGFRERDRLSDDYESRLREGYVLDPEMRRIGVPASPELIRGMAPPPPGYRYVVIGGHVVMIDRGYRVHDTIHLELNFGR